MNIFGITMELPTHLSVAWSSFIYLCISISIALICLGNEIKGDYTSKSWRRILGRIIKYPAIILTILTSAWWIGSIAPTVNEIETQFAQGAQQEAQRIASVEIGVPLCDTVFIEIHDTVYTDKSETRKW